MQWYVLFVRTGKEKNVVELLKKRLTTNMFMPFVLSKECIFKVSGIEKKELRPLFPGYVFIEANIPEYEFIAEIRKVFHLVQDIISLLRYSDTEIAIKESERQILSNLCNAAYCVELSSGVVIDDKIYVTEGPLKGLESKVKKINRHKRQASVEIRFMGDIKQVKVALEIIKKI